MSILEERLGRALRCQELAEFLGIDEKTVRQYYKELGGMRMGRLYVFFEKEVIRAIQTRSQVGGRSEEEGQEEAGDLQYQDRGSGLGGRVAKKASGAMGGTQIRDDHGILSH
jgi:predicted transcriptional regulator